MNKTWILNNQGSYKTNRQLDIMIKKVFKYGDKKLIQRVALVFTSLCNMLLNLQLGKIIS